MYVTAGNIKKSHLFFSSIYIIMKGGSIYIYTYTYIYIGNCPDTYQLVLNNKYVYGKKFKKTHLGFCKKHKVFKVILDKCFID